MKTTTEVVSNVKFTLNGADLLHYMNIPKDAYDVRVFIKIPSGGDYSGMDLDVTNERESVVEVTYKQKEILPS